MFTPLRITTPSVLFSVKVPVRFMPELERAAQAKGVAPVDWINRLVARECGRSVR